MVNLLSPSGEIGVPVVVLIKAKIERQQKIKVG
jgi:hypothetical protein